MKIKPLAIVLPLLWGGHAHANIIISETVEGSGYHKAIEIANVGDSAISLDGYDIQVRSNCEGDFDKSHSLDGVVLQPFTTYVVGNGNSGNDQEFLDKLDAIDNYIANFNGDDDIRISKDGQTIDLVGPVNDASNCYKYNENTTMARLVYEPTQTWDESHWDFRRADDFSTLGVIGPEGELPEPVEAIPTTIMAIQGEGDHSPFVDPSNGIFESNEYYEVVGVITHVQDVKLGNDIPSGFFLQDPNGDGNPETPDGIFVNSNKVSDLSVGDEVKVVATVFENYYWTQLNADSVIPTGTTGVKIEPTTIEVIPSDQDFADTMERYESMLVRLNDKSDMHVTRTFSFDYGPYRNNMVMSHGDINYHPNQHNTPGSESAIAQNLRNETNRIFIESPFKAADGEVPWYPEFGSDNGTGTTDDYIRIGANLSEEGLSGVVGYSYGEYRLYVQNEADRSTFVNNDRIETIDLEDGQLTIGTFNVENFFNSPFGGADNPSFDSRGAESQADFDVQLAKITTALLEMNADVFGLIEIENNGFDDDSAISVIVDSLNSNLPSDLHYVMAVPSDLGDEGWVGTDAITNKIIYRPSKVSLNKTLVIDMPQQHVDLGNGSYDSAYQRDALTAVFDIDTSDKPIVVSTNHFKSKGSTCWEDEQEVIEDANLQGSCENFRVSAAFHLAEELNKIDGHKIIMGDLNSYGYEDPMIVLTNRDIAPEGYITKAARDTYIGGDSTSGTPLHGVDGMVIDTSYGYVDVIEEFQPGVISYSYNDTVGTLDYILVDEDLNEHVIDAFVWNINAVESSLFEYTTAYSGDLPKFNDQYRSSDHDPAIIVLDFGSENEPSEPTEPTEPNEPNETNESSGGSTGIFALFALALLSFRRLRK